MVAAAATLAAINPTVPDTIHFRSSVDTSKAASNAKISALT